MTSKQAVLELICEAKSVNFDNDRICFLRRIIEKDLEILDILKNESDSKRIIERDGIVSFHLDMILTTDNYNKIKDWLEMEEKRKFLDQIKKDKEALSEELENDK